MTPGEIWDVLSEHCQASAGQKPEFEAHLLAHPLDVNRMEYRFVGALGFGGKVWLKVGEPPYVTCYPEDLTDERQAMIERANAKFLKLSGIKLTVGALEVLVTRKFQMGQVTKCRLDLAVFYLREATKDGKQVLEFAGPPWYRDRIATVIKIEDTLERPLVDNPDFTEAWAEAALAS